ncbi:beta-hexosaminidase [Echinicola strongylocentroti]|uniref:beta-N-acetylhexosaminidase n=1 Tax=Echinicola strongylocentroti TaxID=1795355 RepID=A0A2Z4ILJ3_9BACT|nr:beta-N-acetylhexosaminidase [Echinicola strongylocentroti]AWW31590.1 beta-hexosaminidase [Echinicola strongylocentroti]
MKIYCLFFFAYLSSLVSFGQSSPEIIPLPTTFEGGEEYFSITPKTKIHYSNDLLKEEAYFLQKELLERKSFPISIQTSEATKSGINLALTETQDGGYQLFIDQTTGITITSATETGIFQGIISLLQLADQADASHGQLAIPTWKINDSPAYAWRGFMLDESRHFFGVEKVKSLLDWMAYYKLNKFHWHLTDAQGWRIAIKKYPKLALVGGIGDNSDPYAPAQYYSQSQIQEIVRYAAERKIDIIPEIDMPGHATAANKAYPEFSGGGSEKYPEFTFHPAKEGTYQYLTDILREVDALFPGHMIHLGGDEVSFGNQQWKNDPEVQQLMASQQLEDLKDVEDYFMKRMADSLFSLNNTILAWDEMAEAGLPTSQSILLWWRHDQPQQLQKLLDNDIPTVICPRIPLYFDFVQQENDRFGRKWGGNFNPLQRVYDFSLTKLNIPASKTSLILGFQANLWTETVTNEDRLDYLTFPRLAALAEIAWTPEEQKDFEDFSTRLKNHLALYQKAGIYFYDPFDPKNHPEPVLKK